MVLPLVNHTNTLGEEFYKRMKHFHLEVENIKNLNSTVYSYENEVNSVDSLFSDGSGSGNYPDDDTETDSDIDSGSGEQDVAEYETTVKTTINDDFHFNPTIKPSREEENINERIPSSGSTLRSGFVFICVLIVFGNTFRRKYNC